MKDHRQCYTKHLNVIYGSETIPVSLQKQLRRTSIRLGMPASPTFVPHLRIPFVSMRHLHFLTLVTHLPWQITLLDTSPYWARWPSRSSRCSSLLVEVLPMACLLGPSRCRSSGMSTRYRSSTPRERSPNGAPSTVSRSNLRTEEDPSDVSGG